jgi:hypothetical protein
MGQLEADEGPTREQSGIAPSPHRTVKEAGIDDPMHLPQRHAGDGGRLIRGYKYRLVR